MEHTVSALASPHITEIETLGAKKGKSIMGKAEYRDFDVFSYLDLGRNKMSGGAYGEILAQVVYGEKSSNESMWEMSGR